MHMSIYLFISTIGNFLYKLCSYLCFKCSFLLFSICTISTVQRMHIWTTSEIVHLDTQLVNCILV